ncbi:alpha-2-macroglobulin-like [Mustelus asterias]
MPHYVALIPSELRTDSVEKVCVLLLSAVESPHLTLTIQNIETNSTILRMELPTSTGFNCINFTIGESEMSRHSYNTLLSVSVKGSGENLSVSETKMVVLRRYDSLTFVQTDKPVYKPGQIVKFRIVTLNDRFIPVQEEYPLVTVWDPEGNRIGQWKDLTPRQGIVDLTYDLMPEPMQGSYRIEVLKKQGKVEHSFTVEEYVLPTAELTVKMPASIMMTDPVIHIEVCGRYTYGKPVKGLVNGTVCLQSYNYFASVTYCEHVDGKTDANGCLVTDLSTKSYKFVKRRFTDNVRANFIMVESGTGLHLAAFGETSVNPEISKITFEGVEDHYKKGLPYSGQVRIQYSTGGPVRNASIFLFCSLKPGAEKLTTDENGLASFSLDTTTWGSLPVSFTAIYQGGYLFQNSLPHHKSGHHMVKPFYSRSSSFLSIQKHHQELPCDSQLDVEIHYTITCPTVQEKASLDVFYLVMSRGLIVKLNQKTISVGGSEGLMLLACLWRSPVSINVTLPLPEHLPPCS